MHPSLTAHLTRAKPTHGQPHLPMARACAWLIGNLGMLAAAPTLAQQAPASTPTDNANVLQTVVISGQRLTSGDVAIGTDKVTSTVTISRDALLSAPAGVSGLKMLESLPGFNVQANDTLGLYEFGNSVSVRAFNFQQIGFLLDDIPMGRSDQFGGSPIYRYVENENLASVEASSGAGDISRPSYASLGPIVTYRTANPAREAGAAISQTFGSDKLRRTFLRAETGEHNGLSATLSGSQVTGDLWRGPGDFDRKHVEAKVRLRLPQSGQLVFQTVHNDYSDYDSPSITLAQYSGAANDAFGRSGRDFAYLGTLPVLTPTVPGIAYSNPLYANYYKFAVNSRRDHLYALTLQQPVSDRVSVSATLYREDKSGSGASAEAYATSLSAYNAERRVVSGLNAPLGLQYGLSAIDGDRTGATLKASLVLDTQTLEAGGWVERDNYHRTRARYNTEGGAPDGAPRLDQPVHLQADYRSQRDTVQLFFKDTINLLDDRLKLELGAKTLDIDYNITGSRNATDYINRRQPSIDANWKGKLLPQLGGVWSFNPRDQLFTSVSKNLALPRGADDIFSAASPSVPAPAAEKSTNWELGLRTNQPTYNASWVVYRTDFQNRLQAYAAPVPGSPTTETFYQNVGRVSAWGTEVSSQWKPAALRGKTYFNANASYNIARFKDGFNGIDLADKRVPDFPSLLLQGGVTWEPTSWAILNLSARHVGARYSNFVNTEQVGGYTIFNAYADFSGLLKSTPLRSAKLRLNIENLSDKDYLGTINTVTSGPATYRPAPARAVQLTLSAEV